MILRVKNAAELDKLAGRAPQAARQTPAAPAPAPVKAAPPAAAPAAPLVDHEARALLRANIDITRALGDSVQQVLAAMKQQAAPPVQPPAAPSAVPPAEPAPQPGPRLLDFLPQRPVLDVAAPAPVPEAAPEAAPAPPPAPITATIARDRKDRLSGVAMTGGTNLQASIVRGKLDRITEITVQRDGQQQKFIVQRDKRDRIETIKEQG